MITLTRLSGTSFAINPDLIERVDATPDTVLTLVDGTKYVVSETLHDVTEAVRYYRASLLSIAARIEVSVPTGVPAPRAHLHAVTNETAGQVDEVDEVDDADDADDGADAVDRFVDAHGSETDDADDCADWDGQTLPEPVRLHSHPHTEIDDDDDDDAPTARVVALPGGEL